MPPIGELIDNGDLEAPSDYYRYPSPALPMAVARRLLADCFTQAEHYTLAYWRGDYWHYNGAYFARVEDELDVKSILWKRLEQVTYDKDGDDKAWAPTSSKISGLMEPLAICCKQPLVLAPPLWVDTQQPALGTIAMTNGIFNLNSRKLEALTPRLFTTWGLSFAYDEKAQCPNWLKFLNSIFSHDPQAIDALQEFCGYLISGNTHLHKGLMLIGPSRAGKGTISGIIQALMGHENVATTTLHDIGGEFGLSALIGKPLTVIEDARGDSANSGLVVERLLNIIANDSVSINRKGKDYWNGRLDTRLLLVSNEVPRLKDSSGAILTRFVAIHLEKSFSNNEQDKHLGARLRKELPGIFNWALAGLDRLNQNNSFTEPVGAEALATLMDDMARPVNVFFDECESFEITGNRADYVPLRDVHQEYRLWANGEERGRMNQTTFAQAFTAAYTHRGVVMMNTIPAAGVKKNRYLFGVKRTLRT
ncbi:phage/plasmid primase, P4 family [Corynebacterium sp. HS2168-gen11]|uniref:DNA primase family protein n=1 Tax=Corynebacterium sp. HS2168-gen11 TaxID=2974027 RepID=UPI00216AC4A4|nr:phage/plasmid primase, P4 family [Corynebacterium sp. HS2168-gen11]MCS4535421.1 phage/plasmid primase, P4 family [Corynebacterium sp. HS2168-gen11]